MAKKAAAHLAIILVLPCHMANAASPAALCDDTILTFIHKAELPTGILSALGFEMADRDEPFQKTDAILQEYPRLPFHQFMSAQQMGCRLYVNYERGGRGYGQDTALFEFIDGGWVLRHAR